MSRSGYSDDLDNWSMIKWRGMVASATRGKRGQKLFRELAAALDAMPEKRLIAHELKQDTEYCALGVLGAARGIDMEKLDPTESEDIGDAFNIAAPLAQEIFYQNDEWGPHGETPEQRWERMRMWVQKNIREAMEAAK